MHKRQIAPALELLMRNIEVAVARRRGVTADELLDWAVLVMERAHEFKGLPRTCTGSVGFCSKHGSSRASHVLELHEIGFTYPEIGAHLGVSADRAQQIGAAARRTRDLERRTERAQLRDSLYSVLSSGTAKLLTRLQEAEHCLEKVAGAS